MGFRYNEIAKRYNATPQPWMHGEPVTYTFSDATQGTISAIVFRRPLAPTSDGKRLEYQIEVFVSSADIPNPKCGVDSVRIQRHLGDDTLHTRTVRAREAVAGGWHLTL